MVFCLLYSFWLCCLPCVVSRSFFFDTFSLRDNFVAQLVKSVVVCSAFFPHQINVSGRCAALKGELWFLQVGLPIRAGVFQFDEPPAAAAAGYSLAEETYLCERHVCHLPPQTERSFIRPPVKEGSQRFKGWHCLCPAMLNHFWLGDRIKNSRERVRKGLLVPNVSHNGQMEQSPETEMRGKIFKVSATSRWLWETMLRPCRREMVVADSQSSFFLHSPALITHSVYIFHRALQRR